MCWNQGATCCGWATPPRPQRYRPFPLPSAGARPASPARPPGTGANCHRYKPLSQLDKEYQSLAAFAKTAALEPGAAQTVELSFDTPKLSKNRYPT